MTDWLDPPIPPSMVADEKQPASLADHPFRRYVGPLNKAIRAARGCEVPPSKTVLDGLARCFDEGIRLGLSHDECLACLIHAGVHWHDLPDEIVWAEARDDATHERHPIWREFSPGLMAKRMGLLAKAIGLEEKVRARQEEAQRAVDSEAHRQRIIAQQLDRLEKALAVRYHPLADNEEEVIAGCDEVLTREGFDVEGWLRARPDREDCYVNPRFAGKVEEGPTCILYAPMPAAQAEAVIAAHVAQIEAADRARARVRNVIDLHSRQPRERGR